MNNRTVSSSQHLLMSLSRTETCVQSSTQKALRDRAFSREEFLPDWTRFRQVPAYFDGKGKGILNLALVGEAALLALVERFDIESYSDFSAK